MNESHYAFHFFRLWGIKEGQFGIQPDDALLGNSQNDFDAKFGDLAARVGLRYFLVEFKLAREGIAQEVKENSGKVHRYHLYKHLREDKNCRNLARFGHFAAYPDQNDQLAFEPYAHAVADVASKAQIANDLLGNNPRPYHELDYESWRIGFDDFYKAVTEPDMSPLPSDPGFYAKGLGLSKEQLEEYIQCMYQHLHQGEDKDGTAVLGVFDPKKNRFVAFNDTLTSLVTRLHNAFDQLAQSMNTYVSPKGSTGP